MQTLSPFMKTLSHSQRLIWNTLSYVKFIHEVANMIATNMEHFNLKKKSQILRIRTVVESIWEITENPFVWIEDISPTSCKKIHYMLFEKFLHVSSMLKFQKKIVSFLNKEYEAYMHMRNTGLCICCGEDRIKDFFHTNFASQKKISAVTKKKEKTNSASSTKPSKRKKKWKKRNKKK